MILGNSTSYGLQLLVQGVDWRAGDQVLLVDGDFPATIVPWLPLAERGVRVRLLRPEGGVLDAGQLEAELTPATRLLCTSWVFSFTGQAVDLAALGRVCRRAGVTFVVNGSQAVGARPLDLATLPVDALVSCGFKWLCGPYGTGFCWLHPALLASLTYRPAYWLGHLTQDDLGQEAAYRLRDDLGAAAYDVFGTANFLHLPALDGLGRVPARARPGRGRRPRPGPGRAVPPGPRPRPLPAGQPRPRPPRSTPVVFGHHQPERTPALYRRLAVAGVDVAFRRGRLRVSPHLYNTEADVDRALEVLDGSPPGRFRLTWSDTRATRPGGRGHAPAAAGDRPRQPPGVLRGHRVAAAGQRGPHLGDLVPVHRHRAGGAPAGRDRGRRVALGVAALALVPAARRPIGRDDRLRVAFLGVIWAGLPLLLFPVAQQWVDSSVAGMLNGAVPLAGAAWAVVLLGRPLPRTHAVGLLVGFAGVLAISWPQLQGSRATTLGASLVILAVLCYGLAVNLAVPLQQRHGALPVLLRAQLAALVLLLPFGLWGLDGSRFAWPSVLAMVPLGVLGTGLAFVLMTTLVGRVAAPAAPSPPTSSRSWPSSLGCSCSASGSLRPPWPGPPWWSPGPG